MNACQLDLFVAPRTGRPAEDLEGQRFGRLVVTSRAGSMGRHARWVCRCDCGGLTVTESQNLKSGRTSSCGCALREHARTLRTRTTARAASARAAAPMVGARQGGPAVAQPPVPTSRTVPPPRDSETRQTPRMLPLLPERERDEPGRRRSTPADVLAGNAQFRRAGVERRDDCASYDRCLRAVDPRAEDARCPRGCAHYEEDPNESRTARVQAAMVQQFDTRALCPATSGLGSPR